MQIVQCILINPPESLSLKDVFCNAFMTAKKKERKDIVIKEANLGTWVELYEATYQQEVEPCGKSTSLAIIPGFDPSSTTN